MFPFEYVFVRHVNYPLIRLPYYNKKPILTKERFFCTTTKKGRRPAIVISNYLFTKNTGLAIVCPITRADRKFPFHVKIPTVIMNKNNQKILLELVNTRMPFGKYKGRYLSDLPEPYLVWFHQKGFPDGKLGVLLGSLYEIKLNGLEYLLKPLKNNTGLVNIKKRG